MTGLESHLFPKRWENEHSNPGLCIVGNSSAKKKAHSGRAPHNFPATYATIYYKLSNII